MTKDIFLTQMNSALMTVLIVSLPPLAAAIAVGVGVGLLQALTQIQDQTLPQAVKLIAVLLVVILIGPFLASQVAILAGHLLDDFASLTR